MTLPPVSVPACRRLGDANLDGVVTGSKFTALVENLGKSASGADVVLPASDYAAIDAFAAANGLMADVPEPSVFAIIGIAGAPFATGVGAGNAFCLVFPYLIFARGATPQG